MTLCKLSILSFSLAFAAALPVQAFEVAREESDQKLEIPAGDNLNAVLACSEGTVVSGGYSLTSAPDDRTKFAFVANHSPFDNFWAVKVENTSDETIKVEFDMSIICLKE